MFEPPRCSRKECGNTKSFQLNVKQSNCVDWQKVRLQESSEEIPPGSMPRSIDVRALLVFLEPRIDFCPLRFLARYAAPRKKLWLEPVNFHSQNQLEATNTVGLFHSLKVEWIVTLLKIYKVFSLKFGVVEFSENPRFFLGYFTRRLC